MNIERMKKLAEFMDKLAPVHFNIKHWMLTSKNFEDFKDIIPKIESDLIRIAQNPEIPGECGSAACVAGWTPAVFSDELEYANPDSGCSMARRKGVPGSSNYVDAIAQKFLDLTDDEANQLFYPHGYKEGREVSGKVEPQHVAEKIREMIANATSR